MTSDYRELLSALNAHRVRYLIAGAYAVGIHAQPRATKDLDILVKADAENARAVFAALAEFGTPLAGSSAMTKPACARISFPVTTGSPQSAPPADCRASPTSKQSRMR